MGTQRKSVLARKMRTLLHEYLAGHQSTRVIQR